MEVQEVTVKIKGNGCVEIAVTGVSGTHCLQITNTLEQRLGNIIGERKMIESDPPLETTRQLRIGKTDSGGGDE